MRKKQNIIPLTYDFMFKALFGNEKNIKILTKLISDYFKIEYKQIEGKVKILNNELIKNNKKDKRKSVDVIVEINKNEILNIEMNANKNYPGLIERNTSYICKIYSEQYTPKDDYVKTKRCVQINFNNFRMEGEKEGRIIYKLMNEEHKSILTKNLEIHHINMEYISKMCYNEFTHKELYNWVNLIKSLNIEDIKRRSEFMGEEMREEFTSEVDRLSHEEHLIGVYDGELHEKRIRNSIRNQALEEGHKEGIKEGIEQKTNDVVINMLKEDIDISIISKVTELNEDIIENIKKTMDRSYKR